MLNFSAICPHPPIIVPTIGRPSDLEKVKKTILAMEALSQDFAKKAPKTVVLISPHLPQNFNSFLVISSPLLFGHFYNFGDFSTELIFKNNLDFLEKLKISCQKEKISLSEIQEKELDHGTLVPLYFLSQHFPNFKLVPFAFSFQDIPTHFLFGQILQKVIEKEKDSFALIASGDLSHCLSPDAPGGFSKKGKEFDEKIVNFLKEKKVKEILNMDPSFLNEAQECGYRSIVILLGALSSFDWKPEILSYEGPFGVGYLVAQFKW